MEIQKIDFNINSFIYQGRTKSISQELFDKSMEDFNNRLLNNPIYGEVEVITDNLNVSVKNISHIIINTFKYKNDWYCVYEILKTDAGKKLKKLVENKILFRFVPRIYMKNSILSDIKVYTFDLSYGLPMPTGKIYYLDFVYKSDNKYSTNKKLLFLL